MPGGGVLPGGVFRPTRGELLHSQTGAAHQGVDVDTGGGDGQQTHGGKDRIPASHRVGYNELLISFRVGQPLQGAAAGICSGIDTPTGSLFAVFLLQHGFEDTEGHSWFRGSTRLRDDVDRKVPVTDEGDELQQAVSRQSIASKVNIGRVLFLQIIVGRGQ